MTRTRRFLRSLLKYLPVFLAGGLAGAGVTWHIVSQYGSPFQANTLRDIEVRSLLRHQWAERLDRPGLPNLHQVSDALYRGAQPQEGGYASLKRWSTFARAARSGRRSSGRACTACGSPATPGP